MKSKSLQRVGQIETTDLADRFETVLEKDVIDYSAERSIIQQQSANVLSAEMFHHQKHVEFGGTLDSNTSRSIPTSPFGLVVLSPPLHTHTGGQLRIALYIIKG